jgi:hypothetical protein
VAWAYVPYTTAAKQHSTLFVLLLLPPLCFLRVKHSAAAATAADVGTVLLLMLLMLMLLPMLML